MLLFRRWFLFFLFLSFLTVSVSCKFKLFCIRDRPAVSSAKEADFDLVIPLTETLATFLKKDSLDFRLLKFYFHKNSYEGDWFGYVEVPEENGPASIYVAVKKCGEGWRVIGKYEVSD